MVNSNFYGLVSRDLVNQGKQFFIFLFKDAVYIHPTNIQSARAANIVCAAFQYRTQLDNENIKPVYHLKIDLFL
jgi:hypothetical protein